MYSSTDRFRYSVLILLIAIALFAGCKKDDTTGPPPGPTPITADLFPLTVGHQFVYVGYAIGTTGTTLPDTGNIYKTSWTLPGVTAPLLGKTAFGIVDTTTFQHPIYGALTVSRTLWISKDSASGDFDFLQTLGPFFRAFGIARTDTLRWIAVAKPSVGVGGTWTALDSMYTSGSGASVQLQILGSIVANVSITDSSGTVRNTYKTRTARTIRVNGTIVVNDITTSELWLQENVGPVQVLIANDSENLGHFRVLKSKNF